VQILDRMGCQCALGARFHNMFRTRGNFRCRPDNSGPRPESYAAPDDALDVWDSGRPSGHLSDRAAQSQFPTPSRM
jgi:hypothetical protein